MNRRDAIKATIAGVAGAVVAWWAKPAEWFLWDVTVTYERELDGKPYQVASIYRRAGDSPAMALQRPIPQIGEQCPYAVGYRVVSVSAATVDNGRFARWFNRSMAV